MATKTIPSPFSDGLAEEIQKTSSVEMRGQIFQLTVPVFRCLDTGTQFTSEEQDEIFVARLEQKWREHNHVPAPAQLTARREALGLSAREASRLLGFGINQFRQYESGELPSESNALLLHMFCQDQTLPRLLQARLAALPSKTVRKLQAATASSGSAFGRELSAAPLWPRYATLPTAAAPRVHSGSTQRQAARRPALTEAWAMPESELLRAPTQVAGQMAVYATAPPAGQAAAYSPLIS